TSRLARALRRAAGRTAARESTAPEEGAPYRCENAARAIGRSARGDEGGGAPGASRARAPRARTGARTPAPQNSQSARSARRIPPSEERRPPPPRNTQNPKPRPPRRGAARATRVPEDSAEPPRWSATAAGYRVRRRSDGPATAGSLRS